MATPFFPRAWRREEGLQHQRGPTIDLINGLGLEVRIQINGDLLIIDREINILPQPSSGATHLCRWSSPGLWAPSERQFCRHMLVASVSGPLLRLWGLRPNACCIVICRQTFCEHRCTPVVHYSHVQQAERDHLVGRGKKAHKPLDSGLFHLAPRDALLWCFLGCSPPLVRNGRRHGHSVQTQT